ncbi:MAG: glutaminase [Rhodobacteraceae bacterium]|nr:glutaminase [Paracoccaceae bacterium]
MSHNRSAIERTALQTLVTDIAARMAGESDRGHVADYIPELAKVPLNRFGLAIAPLDQPPVVAGDADIAFSIQSISKVFSLTLGLERLGATLWQRVGREPSGNAFNSIIQLEYERGVPRNPFINAGAIVLADVLVEGRDAETAIADILALVRELSGDSAIDSDSAVSSSEARTGARNRSLAHFMAAEGNMRAKVEDALSVYFGQCSVAMSCRQLALAGRFLAAGGSGEEVTIAHVTPERARRINALMMTCGCYDASGEVAYRIGLPCKSGVGGGVLAIVPGVASVAAWCPGLDEKGNSRLAMRALEDLAHGTGWSVFGARRRRDVED